MCGVRYIRYMMKIMIVIEWFVDEKKDNNIPNPIFLNFLVIFLCLGVCVCGFPFETYNRTHIYNRHVFNKYKSSDNNIFLFNLLFIHFFENWKRRERTNKQTKETHWQNYIWFFHVFLSISLICIKHLIRKIFSYIVNVRT